MRISFFIVISILLLASCKKERHDLSLNKIPYTGNELRIDGYYYSNRVFTDYAGIAVFYRDGTCINVFSRIESLDTTKFIENEILLNGSLMSSFMNTPSHIGVFTINKESIEFETWEAGRDIITFSNYGKILNDTTFSITKQVNNDNSKSDILNLIYKFKQYSSKPDSTNNFIK